MMILYSVDENNRSNGALSKDIAGGAVTKTPSLGFDQTAAMKLPGNQNGVSGQMRCCGLSVVHAESRSRR